MSLIELARRASLRRSFFFPAQLDAISDKSPRRAWQGTRRSGKTSAAMGEFFEVGQLHPEREYAYVGLTRLSAERICWNIVKQIARAHCPNARLREAMLRVELPNGSALTLYGADRPDWTDRLYGLKLGGVYIDEAAFYHSIDLGYLISEILEPCVTDLRGHITLMSKPGYAPDDSSFFWRVVSGKEAGWSVRRWSWEDNPHMVSQTRELLARESAQDSTYLQRASTRRNWFGEWVSEEGERVYHYDQQRDSVAAPPWGDRPPADIRYTLGVDLGWFDASAFAVIASSSEYPAVYELESYSATEMTLDMIASRIRGYLDQYPGLVIECDPDRRQAFEELRKRYSLPIYAADKSDKRYWIDQVNTDLVAGRYKIVGHESSKHADEMLKLTWSRRQGSGKMIERPGAANDCCDAALYAYRRASQHRYQPSQKKPTVGSREHARMIEDQIEAAEEAAHSRQNEWGD